MAKAPKGKRLEDALERLRTMIASADEETLLAELQQALLSGAAMLAKKAAETVEARELGGLRAELESALLHFIDHPSEDRGCVAKEAIARALLRDDDTTDEVWLRAVRHEQMEGSYGPPVDAAAELRAIAAIGVARSRLRCKVHALIDLLLDRWTAARAGGVRALGYLGTAEALSLVRYKLLLGDRESAVVGECFRALLSDEDDREENLRLIAGYLRGPSDELAEEAALALGECRDARALPVLMEALDHQAEPERRGALLRAVALMRREEAYEALAAWLREASPRAREQARRELAMFAREPALAFLFA